MTQRNRASSADELEGKTIARIEEGYEDTQIVCEDGTTYSIYTHSGNTRDI